MLRWDSLVMGLAGIGCLVLGGYLRFGPPSKRRRAVYHRYRNLNAPRYIRNSLLVLIPLGIVGLLFAASAALLAIGGRWTDAGLLLGLLSFAGFLITVVLAHYPPTWLKPRWLREEERLEQQAQR